MADETKAVKEARAVVTLAELKRSMGDEKGVAAYHQVRLAMGFSQQALAPDYNSYAPDLSLAGMAPEVLSKIEAIIGGKQ